ncbi:MAG: endonuclease [Blastococcus sp.]|nr:endonuclease [Blastococcus sp.]
MPTCPLPGLRIEGRGLLELSPLSHIFDHVFEGFGVGLTVAPVDPPWPAEAGPPEGLPRSPARLGEVLPVAARSDAEKALELQRVVQLEAALAAYKAELVLGLAADRPEMLDRAPGEPGARVGVGSPVPGASEFFTEELAVVLNCSRRSAERLAADSFVLVKRLPGVWAALADGVLDRPRAGVFLDVLGHARREVADPVVARLLPAATELSLGRLRAALTRAVLAVDAAFAEQRRVAAARSADVRMYPTDAGMSALVTEVPAPVAAACWSTVNELAWMRKNDGDPRPIGQLRTVTFADLILRPWDTSRPAVTAVLDVVAPLSSLTSGGAGTGSAAQPGEVHGQPITAAHVRELLAQLDAVCPGGLQAPAGGALQISVTDADGALLAATSRPQLERIARRGCPDHPPGTAGSPPPDRTELLPAAGCGCPVLARPVPVDRYTPSAGQRRFLRRRDRTCRHPGCGQPVARTDIDHVQPYGAGGNTDCANLCCLCRRHHRLKTHAQGWRFLLTPHGVGGVTTPSGITRSTRPPGLRDLTQLPALPAPPGPPPPPEEPPPF